MSFKYKILIMLPCALESIKILKCEEVTFDVVNKAYIYYRFFFFKNDFQIFTLISQNFQRGSRIQ